MKLRALRRQNSSGVALIAALFIVIVVAMLGVFALRIGGDQHQAVALGLLGKRAQAAAESGLEVASYHAAATPTRCGVVSPAVNPIQPFVLDGFTITITCTQPDPASERFELTATAVRQNTLYGAADFVQRRAMRQVGRGSAATPQVY